VWLAVGVAHVLATLWIFGGALFSGRLLYFRDLSTYYAPQYALAAGALRDGVWPLWNPLANAGEPFLLAYPVDLLLLLIGGWTVPLGVGAAMHLLLALGGGSLLGRRMGMGPGAAWLTGAVYGLGGVLLSMVDLLPLFQAAAWAPLVIWAWLGAVSAPTGRRLAGLAALVALQVSTLGAEIVLQTGLAGLVLATGLGDRRRWGRLLVAGLVAGLLSAPAVLGARSLMAGTARERGFSLEETLSFSVHPVAVGEMLLPKLLGDPHAFSDRDYWGRAYSPTGFPYLVTMYLGLPVLLVAAQARGRRRLWALAFLGLLLGLGRYGPLGLLPADVGLPFRGPQKFLFTTHLALALLAGLGLQRRMGLGPVRPGAVLALAAPGAALLVLAAGLHSWPEVLRQWGGRLAPSLSDPRGLVAAGELWPSLWLTSGALALLGGLVLGRGGPRALLAGGLAVVDLLIVNGAASPLAPASLYDLRPQVAALVRPAASEGRYRWFSYGVAHTPGLLFEPVVLEAESDVGLYALDRQALLARTPALDGWEAAFDLDRTGWAPEGATLTAAEATPERFREHYPHLRLANVRWVVSFQPLPADLVRRRGLARLPEIQPPLGLYELRDPLPRAFWRPDAAVAEPVSPEQADWPRVVYERPDPHTVRLTASTPPGFIVVLDGHHPDWEAEERSGPVRVRRVLGRYQALPTPGGDQVFTLRYRPAWRPVALALAVLGAVALGLLARRGAPVSPLTSAGTARAILPRRERKATEDRTDGTPTELDSL
jgi:hypothetical protein